MPVYELELSDGRRVKVEGDQPPTDADIDELVKPEPKPEMLSGLVSKQEPYFDVPPRENFITDPMGGQMELVRHPKLAAEGLFNAMAKLGGSAVSPFGAAATALGPVRAVQPLLKGVLAGLGAKNLGEIYGRLSVPQAQPKTLGEAIETMGDITGAVAMTGAAIPEISRVTPTEGLPDATQERFQQESVPTERPGDDASRPPTEPSPGSSVQPETPVQTKEVVTAATYTDPKTGETTTAPNHIEAAAKQDVEAPQSREGRETKDFGYQVETPKADVWKSLAENRKNIEAHGYGIVARGDTVHLTDQPAGEVLRGKPIRITPDSELEPPIKAMLDQYRQDWKSASQAPPESTTVKENVTRSEGTDVARESGQLTEEPERGNQGHSDQIKLVGSESAWASETKASEREEIAKAVDIVNVDDIKGYEHEVAERLSNLVRRAGIWESLRPAVPLAFDKVKSAALEQGADLSKIFRLTESDLMSLYGKDAPEMLAYTKDWLTKEVSKPTSSPPAEVEMGKGGEKSYGQKFMEEVEAARRADNEAFMRRQREGPTKPTTTLPKLVKDLGRDEVERLLGEWEDTAELHPDGKSITVYADPRNMTGKMRGSTKEFLSWYAEQHPTSERTPPTTPPSTGEWMAGRGGELQMSIVPGLKEFTEQDVLPKLKEAGQTVGETIAQIKSTVSPPSMSPEGQLAAGIAREKKAQLAQKDVQARETFAKAKRQMDSLSPQNSLRFIDNIEQGRPQATPEGTALSAALRNEFDKRVAQVRALGTGKLQHVIQDYFPHIWKYPTAAVSWYARILGKRPLRGPASFLKRRSIPLTTDGVAAGLEPVTWNPVELSLLKMHEMDRYVMGQEIFQEYKDKGLAQFSRSDIPPDGYAKIDDRIANVVEYRPTTTKSGAPGAPERVLRGHWYAQEDAARVLNNFLSPGLENYKWFRALRWAGNTLNLAQLGLSGYHFTFTMLDSSTGKLALGIEQLTRGDVFKGAQNVARGIAGIPVANQLEYFLKGSKVLKEYTKPGSVGGDYAKIVDSLLAGGGRTEMPRIFRNSSLENFMTAIRSGNYPGAVIRAPFALIQAVSHPLMQVVVPRLKLGAFTDMARYEIQKMGPNVTREQLRQQMGKIWDSVDNRMGEMVYDNLFWNKTLKDTSFLAVRAVGWNLGTIRELGGGVVDTAKVISRLRSGDPIMTRKMAYTIALPITVGAIGAMYQYMKTGKGPSELKDYFYPKTGRTLPDGTPERVVFPSYLKDIYAYTRHPMQTVINKLHPMWSTIHQMLINKDYYGAQTRNPDDPLVKQVGEELNFVGKQFVPFSKRGLERRAGAKESPEIKAESFMGIMPIPPEIARTAAQNKIMEYGTARMGQGGKTVEEQQRLELKRDLESQIKSPEDYGKARQELQRLSRAGKLIRGQALYEQGKLRFEAQQQSAGLSKSEAQWLWRFKHLSLPEMMHVYEMATPQEKKVFERTLRLKERNQ